MPARRENDSVGDDYRPGPVLDVEGVDAKDAAVVHEQAADVEIVAHRYTDLCGAGNQRPLDLAAGVIAGETGAPPAVRTEETLREPAIVLTRELHAVAHELLDRYRRLSAKQLDDARVSQPVSLPQRVGRVLFPAVLGIHRRQCSIDASGGEHGVRVITPPLAHAHHLHPAFG